VVSHHGWYQSNSLVFLNGIAPRVAVMDNGAKKGGTPSAWDIIEKSPRLEGLWQLHFSEEGGAAHNVASEFIANPEGSDAANYLKLTAWPDGNFEVFNSRTQKTKRYSVGRPGNDSTRAPERYQHCWVNDYQGGAIIRLHGPNQGGLWLRRRKYRAGSS